MHGNATVALVSTVTTTDDHGDTSTSVTETAWPGCAVAPRYANETTDSHQPNVVIGLTVYGPTPPSPIDSDDKLRIDGLLYDIEGRAGTWTSPFTGWAPGVEVACKRAAAV